ncbi:Uncharacterized protein GBIM_02497 [Gryllus bimaculatus]|nr:Uncharacterized protein GBIM_02497 [Gryllus bimaculatus]
MKFIQTLISDGMSMNSLKPSINTEAESSLDTCIMKETPVDDCILTKERNSQNNGDKELCLTDYEMGNVENTAKKMFEQVDLNSSMPNSEVSLKKDSWNSEALYDNSSEKENIELNDVRYDILSDEDDNESIHLKISSDDDNSVTESETNEPNSVCNKQLDDSNDKLSQNVTEDGENPNSPSEVHNDLQNESNCVIPNEEEEPINDTSEKDASFDGYEIEGRITVGDSEHEDIPEDFESMPSCSDSPKHNVNDSITSDTMVNEAISPPHSHENSPSVEKDLDPVNANSENVIKENTAKEDTQLLPIDPQDESKHDSSPDHLSADSEMKDLLPGNSTSEEKNISIKDNEDNLSSANDADSVEVPEKEVNSLSGVNDSDSCVGQSQENVLKINDAPKSGEESSNECIEEEEEEKQLPNRAFDEVHSEPKEDESSESDDSAKDRTSLNESSPQSDVKSLEETSPLKESTDSEEKFLEILEYQPANEEVEELREIQPDKDILGDEIQQEVSDEIEQEQQSESQAEKELESNNSPSMVPKDVECSSPKSDAETSPFSSPQSNSTQAEITNNSEGSKEKDGDTKESVDNDNEEDAKRDKFSEVASCSKVIDTETISDDREDLGDVECVSEVSAKKQVLPEISEAQSGRKRTSSNEENLVNCSKRTKVAVSESENQTSDVLMSELPTDSDSRKKCSEADTKEKCDSRTKRLSNSVDDAVQIKKIRVMPEVSISDKDEKLDKQTNSSESLETKKSSDNNTDARKEASNLGKHPMPFLRTLNRAQFQNMSRNDLEELILQKMCEAVTQRSKCGELRELAQTLEEKLKTWQKKCVQLTKQVKDLNVVLKRYGSDLQSKGPGAIPVRITRSVGLQVQMPGISGSSWNPEESTKRKSEKTPPPTPTSSVSTSGTNSSKASSPVAKPTSTAVQKVSDGSDVQASTASTRLNTPTHQPVGGIKALQTKPPASANPPATPNKTGKAQPPVNRVKSDHQVIDLTDGEDKTKNTTTRLPVVSSSPATTVSVPTVSTTVTSSVSNAAVATMSIPANRSIRVVQQLGTSSTPIIAQSAANAVAGQRVAYFVPSTSVPVQPRQLIISSPSQVRPAGVASMSQRQNPLPTIVLKPGQVVPVSSVAGGGNIIRTSSIGSSLQLTRQPRTGQLIQRFPINANSVQSTGLSVVQSSGLTVSSVSQHPAPLPPVPSGPSNANWKLPPPKPDLKISKVPNRNQQGIVLSWNMTVSNDHEQIASYQLFAYQEGNAPPSTHLWKKVGDVTALPLPMACTLTQFMEGHKYHFAVRAVDVFARCGPFSAPGNIVLSRH